MHMNGTIAPGIPIQCKYMKCVTYIPPLIVKQCKTWEHQRIMQITQEFLDVIGTWVITCYQDGMQMMNWHYCLANSSTSKVLPNASQPTLPMQTSSVSITILGQASDDLDQHSHVITSSPHALTTLHLFG